MSLEGSVRAADDWTFPVANVVDGKEVPATYTPIPVGKVTKRAVTYQEGHQVCIASSV